MSDSAAMTGALRPPTRAAVPLLWVAGIIVAVQALAALLAPLIAPYDPVAQDIFSRLQGPSSAHLLGADNLGRDVFARILYGYRTLFAVSFLSVALSLAVGGTIGVMAGWRGGWLDHSLMRLMDVLFGFPIILLAIGVVAVLGPGVLKPMSVFGLAVPMPNAAAIAIAVAYTPIFARVLRGPAMLVSASDYVTAARAIGAGDARILLRHVVPNLAAVILVQVSLSLSTAILVEASLSFLGLGTQPPTPSLGRMLAEARNFLPLSPWPAIFSGIAILTAALGFNLLGDALQDRLDPRLRIRGH